MIPYIAGILVLLSAAFAVVAGIGLLRFPDVLIRMHASTKVGTLSCGLLMAAVAVLFGTPQVIVLCVVIVVFLLLTAPIAGHMIGRAALRTGVALHNTRRLDQGQSPDKNL